MRFAQLRTKCHDAFIHSVVFYAIRCAFQMDLFTSGTKNDQLIIASAIQLLAPHEFVHLLKFSGLANETKYRLGSTVKPHLSQHPFIATPVYCNLSLPFIAINFTIFFSFLLVEGVVT